MTETNLEARVAKLEAEVAALLAMSPRPKISGRDMIRWRLPAALPELQRQYPDGVGIAEIARHFGLTRDCVIDGVRVAARAGKIVHVKRPGEHRYTVLLPGQTPPEHVGLTAARARVLAGLHSLADRNGAIAMSCNEISRRLGINKSTLDYTMRMLVADRRIRLIKPGRGGRNSVWWIAQATTDADVITAAFRRTVA